MTNRLTIYETGAPDTAVLTQCVDCSPGGDNEACGLCQHNAAAIQRLADFEDSGLTPERVAELAAADADGRLVVLPFNQGDTMYELYEDEESGEPAIAADRRFGRLCVECICNDSVEGAAPLDEIGKTMFLSRIDALCRACGESR